MAKIPLLLVLMMSAVYSHAATFYVDQTGGSDSNSGSSPGSPWKNCPGMSAYVGAGTLSPGDIVYFDSADTWPLTGAQGLFLTGGVSYVGDAWGTGTRARLQAASDLDAGVVRFRDNPVFETVFKGFEVDANGRVATGIDINHRYGLLMNGAMKRVENCVVHHIWSRTSLGQYKYGIIISNHGGSSYVAENVEILNTSVHDVSRAGICLYPGDENSGCRIANITVRGCEVFNAGQDPDYAGGEGIVVKGYVVGAFIEYNYVHDTDGASMFINGNETYHYGLGPTNIHLRYNILTCNNINGAIRVYDTGEGDPKDIKIYGNIIYNSTVGGGFRIDRLSNSLSLVMDNNTFFNAPIVIYASNAVVTRFELTNNILWYPGGKPLYDQRGDIMSQSSNLAADPSFKNPAALPTGFAGISGVDRAPNLDGLSLLPGSGAIDRGVPLPDPYAGSINSVPRPAGSGWDIGAYESRYAQPAPLSPPTRLRAAP